LNFMPSIFGPSKAADAELIESFDPENATDEERAAYRKAIARRNRDQAPKHGPSRVRYLTTGQQRRRMVRDSKSEHRKANSRYRRDWMNQTQALANLRGQIAQLEGLAVGKEVTPLALNAASGLVRQFGTYEDPKVVDEDGNPLALHRDANEILVEAKATLAAAVAQRSNG